MAGTGNDRFMALDLLRGIAALAVVILHVPRPAHAAAWLPQAYLAVDLFFVLSGFVIAHAYGERLARGESVARFMAERLIRLYPLYLLATVIGAALILDQVAANGLPARSLAEWSTALGMNLAFLPAPPAGQAQPVQLFPAVFPAWSLMWELLANLAFALLARRLGWPMLGAILGLGLALLIATGWGYGSLDAGVSWSNGWGGGGRVLWGFFAGVALYRLHERFAGLRLPDWALAGALPVSFALSGGWAGDVALAAIGFPLLVLAGAHARSGVISGPIGAGLGYLSYAVYVLHVPAFNLLDKLSYRFSGARLPEWGAAGTALCVAAILAMAWLAARRFDDPVRASLKSRLRRAGTGSTIVRPAAGS